MTEKGRRSLLSVICSQENSGKEKSITRAYSDLAQGNKKTQSPTRGGNDRKERRIIRGFQACGVCSPTTGEKSGRQVRGKNVALPTGEGAFSAAWWQTKKATAREKTSKGSWEAAQGFELTLDRLTRGPSWGELSGAEAADPAHKGKSQCLYSPELS